MKKKLILVIGFLFLAYTTEWSQTKPILAKIEQMLSLKKAKVGFALLGIENKDSLALNGQEHFPMQSVYKFHVALAILEQVDKGKLYLDQGIFVKKSELIPDTWSPLRDKHTGGNVNIKLDEILSYTVSQSDNNGCDILFRLLGGTDSVTNFIHRCGVKDIAISATEMQMHQSWDVQFTNWTTPLATAQLLKIFCQGKILSETSTKYLWNIMIETKSGLNRLKGLLPKDTEVGHKTGTSGVDSAGITAACNDIGIVTLPNGKHYAIAVFITNSRENDEENAKIIAEISKIVWDYYAPLNK